MYIRENKLNKILSLLLCLLLIFQQAGFAQIAGELNIAGRLGALNNLFVSDTFRPLHLRYLSYDAANNNFKLLLDRGSLPDPKAKELKDTAKQLLDYFSVGLTLPSESFWVNLRPDGESNIIDDELAKTDMGRVMLEADLQLKKDTAASTSPKTQEGKKYWDTLYKKAEELFGSENVNIPTLTRVWIVPDEIILSETQTSAYIYKATLKVLLEQDYLKDSAAYSFNDPKDKALNEYSSRLYREIIIPKLTRELNTSKRYAPLRQVYYSLIMAEWFKARFSGKGGLYPRLINRRDLTGLTSKEPWSKSVYFKAYQRSVNDGEYDIQETKDVSFSFFHQTARRYVCGGVEFSNLSKSMPGFGFGVGYIPDSKTITYLIPNVSASPSASGHSIGVEVNGGQIEITSMPEGPATAGPVSSARAQLKIRSEQVLGRALTDTQLDAVVAAHNAGEGHYLGTRKPDGTYEKNRDPALAYTVQEIAEKARLLAAGGFNQEERRRLMEYGVAGEEEKKGASKIQSLIERIRNMRILPKLIGPAERQDAPRPPPSSIPAKEVRESPAATEYSYGDFRGVDLEHFVHAQVRLDREELSVEQLRQTLVALGLDPGLGVNIAYRRIYEALAAGRYNKKVIDIINGLDEHSGRSTYDDPRLSVTIVDQNKNARAQGVYEAVSNGLDALGFKIGQFGKGVKQIIDWLEPTGEDRIDVYTRKENGRAYQLTILQDTAGQNYIQIREMPVAEFKRIANEASAKDIDKGTVVRVATGKSIPARDDQRDLTQNNSLQEIEEGVHKKFPYVTSVEIDTKVNNGAPQKVNGFKEKVVIVPALQEPYSLQDSAGRFVYIRLNTHNITVVDNGTGMDAAILSGMFVPKVESKEPQFLSGEDATRELDKVKVVYDKNLPHRVSFSRNGEVVSAVNIPESIHPKASASGGLMIEFGLLLDVPESRDNVIIPSSKSGGESGFQRAVMHAVSQILRHPRLSAVEKARFINTIAIGLDGLIQGNENNNNAVKNIRALIQDALSPVIEGLRKEGFIILPHNRQFDKIQVARDKEDKVLFVHEGLFNWQGAVSLKEVGAEVIPGIKLGGEKRLLTLPFKKGHLGGISGFQRLWHTWAQDERIPVIKTDRFVAVPLELGERLRSLAVKKRAKGLDTGEEKEFASLAQLLKIITAEEVVTSYEITASKESLIVEDIKFDRSQGEIDSEARNGFLTAPVPGVRYFAAPQEGSLGQAMIIAQKLSDEDPVKSEVLVYCAMALARAGKQEDSIKQLREISGALYARYADRWSAGQRARIKTLIGRAYAQLGDDREANAAFNVALSSMERMDASKNISKAAITALIAQGLLRAGDEQIADQLLYKARDTAYAAGSSLTAEELEDLVVILNVLVEAGKGADVKTVSLFEDAWNIARKIDMEAMGKGGLLADRKARACVNLVEATAKSGIWAGKSAGNILALMNQELSYNYFLPLVKLYVLAWAVKEHMGDNILDYQAGEYANEIISGIEKIQGPFRAEALAQGADVLAAIGYNDKAREWIEESLKAIPARPAAIHANALIHIFRSRITDIAAKERPEDTRPQESEVLFNKAVSYKDRITSAPEVRLAINARIIMEMAEAGKKDEVIAGVEESLKEKEFLDDSDLALLGKALARVGEYGRALDIFNEALAMKMEHAAVARMFAESISFGLFSEMDEASKGAIITDLLDGLEEDMSQLTAMTGRSAQEKLADILYTYFFLGDYGGAVLAPSNFYFLKPEIMARIAQRYLNIGDIDAAEEYITSAVRIALEAYKDNKITLSERIRCIINTADELIKAHRTKEALQLIDIVYKDAGSLLRGYVVEEVRFARLYEQAGEKEKARQLFENVVQAIEARVSQRDYNAVSMLSRELARAGKNSEAAAFLDKIPLTEENEDAFIIAAEAYAILARQEALREKAAGSGIVAGEGAFSDAKPQGAGNSFVIRLRSDGKYETLNIDNTGDSLPGTYAGIERVGEGDVFILHREDGAFTIYGNGKSIFTFPRPRGADGAADILARKGNLLVLEVQEKKGKAYCVIDAGSRKKTPALGGGYSRRAELSASGRFSVHEDKDGVVYYDHAGDTQESRGIALPGYYKQYLVYDKADLVVLQDNKGKYSIYGLEQGRLLTDEHFEHIEIDSSGEVAILKNGDKLDYLWLRLDKSEQFASTPHAAIEAGDKIRTSAANDKVYLMVLDRNGRIKEIRNFLKDERLEYSMITPSLYAVGALQWKGMIPQRYWEEYDLKGKGIWDRDKNDKAAVAPLLYQAGSPVDPQRNNYELHGNICIWLDRKADGHIGFVNLDRTSFKNITGDKRLSSLEGGAVWYTLSPFGAVNRVVVMSGEEPLILEGGFRISSGNRFILASLFKSETELHRQQYSLIDGSGRIVDISSQLPEGFVYTETIGDYFIFLNPATNQVKYLDPRAAFSEASGEEAPLSPELTPEEESKAQEEAERAAKIWKEEVFSRREALIAKARAGYGPLLEIIPEESRGEIEDYIAAEINKLYAQQENQIRERFSESIYKREPVNLEELIFDSFSSRISSLTPAIKAYIKSLAPALAQEQYAIQKAVWMGLFSGVFKLSADTDLNIDNIGDGLLEALSYGWVVSTQEQVNAIPMVNKLITEIRDNVSSYGIGDMHKIVALLSHFVSRNSAENISILKAQLEDEILAAKPQVKRLYLEKLVDAFKGVDQKILHQYINNPSPATYLDLGRAGEFVVFLTIKGEQLVTKERFVPEGEEVIPQGHQGVAVTQIMQLEEQRKKLAESDTVMDIKALIAAIENNDLPLPSEEGEAKILLDTKVQRESGAYTAEITQNSKDATKGRKGELKVSFYLQEGPEGKEEYVEEASDNGTGALQEVALLIPKSTKASGAQKEATGFFGTGKYTIFEGVDRVEIITRNNARAYMFSFSVGRDASGNPIEIRLTNIRELNDSRIVQGVTVRRIKSSSNTIPKLDSMLARRAWKTFAGLTGSENFGIFFIDRGGVKQILEVKQETVSETDFKAVERGRQQETNFGKMRILAAEDMPLQVVDRAGLRVCELKDEYLALIPGPLRKHIEELGIILQIPLPLIRNRSAFEHENAYLPLIQKYVAVEFYKAIVYKALTQTGPQFIFEGFPLDWETNDDYWRSIDLKDETIGRLADKINRGDYLNIAENELKGLLPEPGKLDKTKRFVKLMLMLETDTGKPRKESLYLRRLAIQRAINRARAEAQMEALRRAGMSVNEDDIPDLWNIPHSEEKLSQARGIESAHQQMRHIEDFIVPPENYTSQEKELTALASPIARQFGLEEVLLAENTVHFAGGFIVKDGKRIFILKRSLSGLIGISRGAHIDAATDTAVHELAHLLEDFMNEDGLEAALKEGYVAHASNFTHDAVGTFAEAMKYVAAITLFSRGLPDGSPSVEPEAFEALIQEGGTRSGEKIGPVGLIFEAEASPSEMVSTLRWNGITLPDNAEKIFTIIQRYFRSIQIRAPGKTRDMAYYRIEFRRNVQNYAIIEGNTIILDVALLNSGLPQKELVAFLIFILGHEGSHAMVRGEGRARSMDKERFKALTPIHRQYVTEALNHLGADRGYLDALTAIDIDIGQAIEDTLANGYVYTGTDEQFLPSIKEHGLTSDPEFNHPVSEEDYQFFKLMALKSRWQFTLKSYFEGERQTGLFITGDKETAAGYANSGPERLRIFARNVGEFLNDYETGKIKRDSISQAEIARLKEIHSEYSRKTANRKPIVLAIPIRDIMPLLSVTAQEFLNDHSRFSEIVTEIYEIYRGTDRDITAKEVVDKIMAEELFNDVSLQGTIEFSTRIIIERMQDDEEALTPPQQPKGPAAGPNGDINNPTRFSRSDASGGIDFRNLPIVRKAIGNLRPTLDAPTMNRLKSADLDKEWGRIEGLIKEGVIPSGESIKEYIQASCLKGSAAKDLDKIIACIADILRLEEGRCCSTEPVLQDILIAVESAGSIEQVRTVFIGN